MEYPRTHTYGQLYRAYAPMRKTVSCERCEGRKAVSHVMDEGVGEVGSCFFLRLVCTIGGEPLLSLNKLSRIVTIV
eukprot:1196099-Prorocentrum_minimum.AAC.4